jgi:hypothetical protein
VVLLANHTIKKPVRATAAKEVGMKNPAEKTTVRPNQNPKPILSPPRIKKPFARQALN